MGNKSHIFGYLSVCGLALKTKKVTAMYKRIILSVLVATMMLTSCSKDDDDDVVVPTPEEQVVLNCAKPDYLKAGDRVAMISP